jgi:hypothetical protein
VTTTNAVLARRIRRAIKLDREIEQRKRRLKVLEDSFKEEAKLRAEERTRTDGGGWSWVMETQGGAVRVTQSAPAISREIDDKSDELAEAREIAGEAFAKLFTREVVFIAPRDVRKQILTHLDKANARALINLLKGSGKLSVSYETKESASCN